MEGSTESTAGDPAGSAGNTEQVVPKPETAVSEVPGAEAGTGPLAQHRAGGQTTCPPLDPPPLAQRAACSPLQEPPRAPANGLRSHVSPDSQ